MSQQKFASNVVEKCLTFGGPVERRFLVSEMLGTTDENEPLQVCFFSSPLLVSVYKYIVLKKRIQKWNQVSSREFLTLFFGTFRCVSQAMMKDQFANYVVQKVLETCDDQQRELILSRIKVHLNALKKYTYGKQCCDRALRDIFCSLFITRYQTNAELWFGRV